MSQHSNQKRQGGPTSSRSEIRGNNRTYVSSVQRESRSGSATSSKDQAAERKAGKPRASGPASDPNAFRATRKASTAANANTGGFGDGHYVPR